MEGGIPSERIMVGGFSQGATQSKPWVHPSCRESLQLLSNANVLMLCWALMMAGGAVAVLALRSQHRLAGIVALSAYLALRKFPPLLSPSNAETPVLMCHGDADPTVS